MFCVEEHKWGYFTYIYRCAYSTRIYIGTLATRPHLGDVSSLGGDASSRRHCQVGGRCPNLAIRKCIVFACQGIEPWQANADAGTRRPQVRTRCLLVRTRSLRARTYAYIIFTLRRFFVPCFIFITQCIDNQYFQEMKHWHSMFHFWFQCFSGVSPIGVWFLSHWGFKSLPLGFYFSPTEFLERGVVNKKWNIETKNETLKPKMKHWTPMFHLLKRLIFNELKHKNETWNIFYDSI